jgi:hypothetical protein
MFRQVSSFANSLETWNILITLDQSCSKALEEGYLCFMFYVFTEISLLTVYYVFMN